MDEIVKAGESSINSDKFFNFSLAFIIFSKSVLDKFPVLIPSDEICESSDKSWWLIVLKTFQVRKIKH